MQLKQLCEIKSGKCNKKRRIFHRGPEKEAYYNLIQEMCLQDREKHFNFIRMLKELFEILLVKVDLILLKSVKPEILYV